MWKTRTSCWTILAANRTQSECQLIRALYSGVLLVFICAACSDNQPEEFQFWQAGSTMGTTFSVKIPVLPQTVDEQHLKQEIDEILIGVNQQMSTYLVDSELSKINRRHVTDWLPISQQLRAVLSEALEISRLSSGAFDVTIGPLVNLWGFGPGEAQRTIPNDSEIQALLGKIGYENLLIRVDPPALRKKMPSLFIDLSSLAKGYAVDLVARYLDAVDIHNYLVEIGGELRAKGKKRDGRLWRVAIEKPESDKRVTEQVLELNDIAVATSGDYRNYFEQEGVRYSHTLDPKSGRPITHNLVSVTVLSDTTMHADALATAFMVMGPERGLQLAEREGIPALFISKAEQGFSKSQTSMFSLLTQ